MRCGKYPQFKVTADLSDASVGTIEVPLTIENLPSGLTVVATPQKITVKVGKSKTRQCHCCAGD